MAPEKKISQGSLAGMTVKQKVIAGALVVVVIMIIWQVMGLFGGGSAPEPAQPAQTAMNNNMSANGPGAQPNAPAGQQVPQTTLRQMPVTTDIQFQQMQQKNEEKYVNKINELEELKVQREIAETNQAISTAKLATVTAEKSISDLLTKPSMPIVNAGAYGEALVKPTRADENIVPGLPPGETVETPEGSVAPPPPIVPVKVDYTVISVTMQLHRWTAILGYQGKLYSVNVGDMLPPDGSVVVSISKNIVVLKKDDEIRKISILATI